MQWLNDRKGITNYNNKHQQQLEVQSKIFNFYSTKHQQQFFCMRLKYLCEKHFKSVYTRNQSEGVSGIWQIKISIVYRNFH